MVPIRLSRSANGHSTHRVTFYAVVIATLALTGIYWLSLSRGGDVAEQSTASNREEMPRSASLAQGMPASKNKEDLDEDHLAAKSITQGTASYGVKTLDYYHCGSSPVDNPEPTELVLLHGAAFTKEDWKKSGIMDMFCEIKNEEKEGKLSVVALDLPVSADGKELVMAFDALVSSKILSGRAATFASPSASGKSMVSLGEMASNGSDELARIVKAWIPVASGAVIGASESTLLQYKTAQIPILAIHGDQDAMGRKVTEKLKEVNGAKGVELEGRHPVYLDSPKEFVQEVMRFLGGEGL